MPRVSRRDLRERLARAAWTKPGRSRRSSGGYAGDRELGEEHEVCAGLLRLVEPREDPLPVAVEVADRRVDLSECESHGFRL